MGLPCVEEDHAFVRLAGPLPPLHDAGLSVVACEHTDMDGARLVEALVSGPGAMARLVEALAGRETRELAAVSSPHWVEQSILAASGEEPQQTAGALAVLALRAPEREWHLVSHPHALSATAILAQLARCLDHWVQV